MTRRPRIEDLAAYAVPEQPALSPDGTRIAYVLRSTDTPADRTIKEVWSVGARDGEARRLTRGVADSAPAWSPDGRRIAFLRGEEKAQIWLLPADGGEPEQVTTLPLGAGAPVWSPDGSRIAFAAPVDLRGPAAPENAPIVIDTLDYAADGAGLLGTLRTHLHLLDVATGECRQLTDGDWNAGGPSWSPDSARLAFAAAIEPGSDLTERVPVHVLDLTDPVPRPARAGLAEGAADVVVWTPAGTDLVAVGKTTTRLGHQRLLRLPLAGGDPVDLAGPLDRNVMPGGPGYPGATPQFTDDGDTILFCARDEGCTHLYAIGPARAEPRPVLTGAGRVVAGLSVAAGLAAIVLATPTSFGEIVLLDLATGTETVRTGHTADPEVERWVAQERWFTISDGTRVHGWLLRDPAAAGPQPVLLDIHGGPHSSWNGTADEWHPYHQELVSHGWSVLTVNPRGSDGYGEAFFTATAGRWGEADAADLLEPLDQLVAAGLADPARLAVAGYSYGGYLTCYLTSRDHRFAAAVGGGVVTDLVSMAGTSDAGHYLSEHETGGRHWENPAGYAAQSPLARVGEVNTPTLLLHGEADLRCPPGQAQQWHTALRERGVPTRLVLYPGGSHLFVGQGRPSHRIDYNRRVVEWLERHVTKARREPMDAAHWQRRLAVLAERHKVPGAVLGILRLGERGDELTRAAYGVLNVDTGVPVTDDSLFQIGSMTKVWTTTLAVQLADDGLLDLDAPVVDVLPELVLADDEVTKRVTMRHLLTHTSGIDGDIFTDTGRGDDCLEFYVAGLRDVGQNHPLGATWSYCNSGFSLAGRVIERLTGGTWDDALRQRLIRPLGLTDTVTLPEEALLHRTAVGHLSTGRTPIWGLPRAMGPAGLISSTVADVLAFARLHLTGGLAPDGRRLVSARGVAAMTEKQADLPDRHTLGDSWGLGWVRLGWDGHRLVGHDGNTIGQSAFLRVLPELGIAVTLLTNGGNTHDLYEDLFAEVFAGVAGVAMARPLTPPADPPAVDLSDCLGRYERAGELIEVFDGPGGPTLRSTATGPLAALTPEPAREYALKPVDQDLFLVRDPGVQTWSPVTFYALPTGERYVHFLVRATPKVA